jgi:hypothetical protein
MNDLNRGLGNEKRSTQNVAVQHKKKRQISHPFSFFRTITVGPGVSPDLLTSSSQGALAGSPIVLTGIPPVGISTPP